MKSMILITAFVAALSVAVGGCSGSNPVGSTGVETAAPAAVAEASYVTLKIYPQRLNLNSEGVLEPVTAVLGSLPLPAGYTVTGWDLGLYFDGVLVAPAELVTYDSDDLTPGAFYVDFDRAVVREYCITAAIMGGVTVQVSGFIAAAGDGEAFEATVTGFDYIEVVKEGNKEL